MCFTLNVMDPYKLLGNGTIGCGFVGIDLALLEELCHPGAFFVQTSLGVTLRPPPVACRSRCSISAISPSPWLPTHCHVLPW